MMKKEIRKYLLAFTVLMLLPLWACSDDDSVSEPSGQEILGNDSIPYVNDIDYEDSLYAWYLKGMVGEDTTESSFASIKKKDEEEKNPSGEEEKDIEGADDEGPVVLLPPAGFYKELTIPVPAATQGGTIRCSFDGNAPDASSEEFAEPLKIEKTTVVRCAEFVKDSVVRKSTQTYFVGETVAMPVVAISVSPMLFVNNYTNSKDGRYCSEGGDPAYCPWIMEDVEYPVHVEYFADGSSSNKKAWEIDAGLSLMGHWSRTNPKKSVSISMRSQYQDGRLKYPLFNTRPEAKKFKAFVLRNNGNRFVGDYYEDPMATSLLEGSGVDYQRSRQVVVFYNGKYYGIHDLREKLNEHFVETNYGIDSKNVDAIKHVAETITASGGTTTGYEDMLQRIYGYEDLANNDAQYKEISSMMDVGNYADYMSALIYYQNGDWPNNNVRAWRSPDQPWKFIAFDLDHGFGWDWSVSGFYEVQSGSMSMFDWIRQGGKDRTSDDSAPCHNNASAKCFHTIFVKLIENPDFKRLFINHAAVMYDVYLNQARVSAAVSYINSTLPKSEISRDQNKFPRSYGHNFSSDGSEFISWAGGRDVSVRKEFAKEFGLGSDIKVTITASGNGSVLLDDMKLPSANYTGTFFGGNDMLLQAVPKAGSVFNGWSDGNPDNPRLVSPTDGSKYTANFK